MQSCSVTSVDSITLLLLQPSHMYCLMPHKLFPLGFMRNRSRKLSACIRHSVRNHKTFRFLRLPASKWGKEHIVACRLIQVAGGKILPILEEFAPEPSNLQHHEEWSNIKCLIDGPSKADFCRLLST
jgi:hypothetical protein